jgi:hypothetical protein
VSLENPKENKKLQKSGLAKTTMMKKKRTPTSASWKLCTTLLGPSTLFLHPGSNESALRSLRDTKKRLSESRGPHTCTSIRCAGCFDTGEAVRASLALALADQEVVQPGHGSVAFFRIGEEAGAVHSEPKCDVDRVFVNIVPGTEEGLRALMGRYGMAYPRAWSMGGPGGIVLMDEYDGVLSG